MKKWLVAALIGFSILLVVIPVWSGSVVGVKSKWALARIANLAEQDTNQAEIELERLASQMPAPKKDCDYWIIKQRIALIRNDGPQSVQIAKSALKELPDFPVVAWIAYDHFHKNNDYHYALRALEVLYYGDGRSPQHPDELNRLAYARSLAGRDLEPGLSEINEALKWVPDSAGYLDTRAWLLFQMGKSQEALDDANKAVEIGDNEYRRQTKSYWMRTIAWFNGKSVPSSSDGLFTEQEADPLVWSLGALRYHRGKILEALGRAEEAEQDWQWLRDHQLPLDDRLR